MSSGHSSPYSSLLQPTPSSTAKDWEEHDDGSVQHEATSTGEFGIEHDILTLPSGFTAQQERWIEEHTCTGRQHQTPHLSTAPSGHTFNIPLRPSTHTERRSLSGGLGHFDSEQLVYLKDLYNEIERQLGPKMNCEEMREYTRNAIQLKATKDMEAVAKEQGIGNSGHCQKAAVWGSKLELGDAGEAARSLEDAPAYGCAQTLAQSIKPHEMGYFKPDPGFQYKMFTDAGKYIIWHDVYAYISHVHDLSRSGHEQAVTSNLSECLRGSALIWWISELTQEERNKLRKSKDLSSWGTTLISRFKLPTCTALDRIRQQSFSIENVRCGQDIQGWIHEMLYLTKCSLFGGSTFNQLLFIWIKIGPELRRNANMKEPDENTTVGEFMKMIRDNDALWQGMVQDGSQLLRE